MRATAPRGRLLTWQLRRVSTTVRAGARSSAMPYSPHLGTTLGIWNIGPFATNAPRSVQCARLRHVGGAAPVRCCGGPHIFPAWLGPIGPTIRSLADVPIRTRGSGPRLELYKNQASPQPVPRNTGERHFVRHFHRGAGISAPGRIGCSQSTLCTASARVGALGDGCGQRASLPRLSRVGWR